MGSTAFERHVHEDPHYPIIFHANNLSSARNDFMTHWHDSPELLYFYSGSGVITLNTEQIRAGIGDVVVINSSVLHTVRSLTPSCSYYCLIADRAYCEELGFEVGTPFCTMWCAIRRFLPALSES